MLENQCLPLTNADGVVDAELYENSYDCIKIVSLDGKIVRLNPGGKTALELDCQEQLDGAEWVSLWPSEARQLVGESLSAARAGKRTQFSAFCPTYRGTERWWDVVINPMRGAGQAVTQFLVVSRDVTETVRAKEALLESNRRKDEFLALLSHELRNPLSALALAPVALNRADGDRAQIERVSSMISRQVGHMSKLAEDLLDVSRVTRQQIDLQLAEIDVRDAVEHSLEQLRPGIAAKGQSITVGLMPDPTLVVGDRIRLIQVFGNIIGNASRYSPGGAHINVSLFALADRAIVEVSDNGKGISAEFMPRLFDMYAQSERATEQRTGGLGLGLAIVKKLVELHNGEVTARSEGEGLGSVFSIHLPLARPHALN